MKNVLILALASILLLSVVLASAGPISADDGSLNVNWRLLDNFLRPSGETALLLTIENPLTTRIYDVHFYFDADPSLTVSPAHFSLNSINPTTAQYTSIKIKASDNAKSGTSYIQVSSTFHVGSVTADEKNLTLWVPVIIRATPLLKVAGINYSPSTIEPGSNVTISFDAKNYGDGLAKDLIVSLDQTGGIFTADLSEKYIGDLPVGSSTKVSFSLTISQDLSAGSYSIPILFNYKDETKNEIFTGRESAGIKVYGKLNLIVTLDSQDKVASGMKGTMEIKIANAGTIEAQFLQLRIPDSPFLEEIIPNNIYIGDLKSDDYDTEKMSFKVSEKTAKGIYPVSFELVYQDPFGKEFTETKTVDLSVLSIGEIGNTVGIPIWQIALIIVVAALIVYYFLRKRRK